MEDTYTVVGMCHGSFSDKQTGNLVRYANLFATALFNKPAEGSDYHTEGVKAFTFKCDAPDVWAQVTVGDEGELFFNKYGKVTYIKPVA